MARNQSIEANIPLFYGATVSDLARVFNKSQSEVQKRLAGRVTPVTKVGEKPVRYKMREAARHLIDVTIDAHIVEDTIKKMPPDKLPPKLTQAFWAGQTQRLAYQEKLGQLWKTERVVEILADAFKPLSITIRMFQDTVSQQVELSEEQKAVITEMSDSLLRSLQESLIETFKDYAPAHDEHGDPISAAEGEAEIMIDRDQEDDGFGDD